MSLESANESLKQAKRAYRISLVVLVLAGILLALSILDIVTKYAS